MKTYCFLSGHTEEKTVILVYMYKLVFVEVSVRWKILLYTTVDVIITRLKLESHKCKHIKNESAEINQTQIYNTLSSIYGYKC